MKHLEALGARVLIVFMIILAVYVIRELGAERGSDARGNASPGTNTQCTTDTDCMLRFGGDGGPEQENSK